MNLVPNFETIFCLYLHSSSIDFSNLLRAVIWRRFQRSSLKSVKKFLSLFTINL